MRALRFYSKGDIRVDDVPSPKCETDDVLIKVAFCGVCGTDIHEYLEGPILLPSNSERNPHTGATLPVCLGHEFSGTISEVGGEVTGLSVGQMVAINPAMDDRHHGTEPCELCRAGRHNICSRSTFYGLSAQGGGFAEEIAVKPFAVVPVPANVSLKLAALAEPLSVAAHMIRISGFKGSQDAVILGAGPIGCALTFLLKDSGARCLIVSEVASHRAAQAKQCGADRVIDPMTDSVLDTVHDLMGVGADVTFDACGLQNTIDTAFACTKAGGTIFNVAIHDSEKTLNLNLLTLPEKRLMAGNAYTAEDFQRVMKVLSSRGADIERFITRIVPLERVTEDTFQELVRNKASHNKILVEVHGEGKLLSRL